MGGVLLAEDASTLRVLDFRLVRERSLERASIRLLRHPATEQEVAARIGVAPVASWFISQALPFRNKVGQVASVDPPDAFINLGADEGLASGQLIDVLRSGPDIRDPITGALLGAQQERVGQAKVVEAQKMVSRIRLVEDAKADLRMGDAVRPVRQENAVAVLPLVNDAGITTRGGLQLAEEITTYLSKNDVPLVERMLLDKAIREMKLGENGRFTDEARTQIGKLLGAHALVLGTIQGSYAKAHVNIRLVETETGKVLYATSLTAKNFDMSAIGKGAGNRLTPLVSFKPFDGQGLARAKYRVNGGYRSLRFTARLNATQNGAKVTSPIVYSILGDERSLWNSGPVKRQPSTLADEVNIEGVKVLEFRVHSLGDAHAAHARWDNVLLVE